MRRIGLGPLTMIIAIIPSATAFGQATPAPPIAPPITTPDPRQPLSPRELDRQLDPVPAGVAKPGVSVRSRGAIVAGPCPPAIANSPLTTPLGGIDFTGVGGAPLTPNVQAALARVAAGLDGSARPIRLVCDLRDAANAALSRARFVASVRVPEQTLTGGRLRLEVITARVTELRVRGDPGPSRERVAALLGKLKALDPFNEAEAERILLLAGDIPGIGVSLELRPSPSGTPGEVVGEVAVERVAGSLFLNAQNYGSRQIGRFSGLVRGELYGLTGMADRTFVGAFATSDVKEQKVLQFGHDFAVGTGGMRLGGQFTYAWTRPTIENGGAGFDLRSKSLLGTVEASYPIVRAVGRNVRIDGGFDFLEQRTTSSGTPINTDKLRIVFLRLDADAVARGGGGLAPAWRLAAGVEARRGLNILSATRRGQSSGGAIPTRFEGNPQAFVARANALGEGRVRFGPASPYAATVSVEARGQWAKSPLLAFDEFSVGNLTLGRGYDPGATSGDRAVGVSTELRLGKPQPLGRNDWAYEAIGFYDAVHIRNLDSNQFESKRTLHSYGGGVRTTFGVHGRLDVLYAHPTDKALAIDTKRAADRVLVSLTIRALPWR